VSSVEPTIEAASEPARSTLDSEVVTDLHRRHGSAFSTSHVTRVAAEPDRLLVPLMWAPDSQSVVFVKYDTGTSGQMLDGIWIVTLGGDVRLLTNQHGIPGPWQAVQD